MKREKPLPGHKFERIRYMAQAICECGWEGGRWSGTGARKEAYKEWHWHREKCAQEAA